MTITYPTRHQCRDCLCVSARPHRCPDCAASAERWASIGTALQTAALFGVLALLGIAVLCAA